MIKTDNCPRCGAELTVKIDPKIGGAKILCPVCGSKIWVSEGNFPPTVFSENLDPIAEAILAEHIPHATQTGLAARDVRT